VQRKGRYMTGSMRKKRVRTKKLSHRNEAAARVGPPSKFDSAYVGIGGGGRKSKGCPVWGLRRGAFTQPGKPKTFTRFFRLRKSRLNERARFTNLDMSSAVQEEKAATLINATREVLRGRAQHSMPL